MIYRKSGDDLYKISNNEHNNFWLNIFDSKQFVIIDEKWFEDKK